MPGNGLPKWVIAAHTVYRYIGKGRYLMAVPARDLTAADLADVQEREGITRATIEASGIYEPVRLVEVAPFCGAALEDGGRCWEPVARWGDRCGKHGRVEHGLQDRDG